MLTRKEVPVVLLNGTQLGTVCCWRDLEEWVQKPVLLKKKVMVAVEPHHHLRPMNGHGEVKKFALIGCGVFAPPRPQKEVGIIFFTDIKKRRVVAVVPKDYIRFLEGEIPWKN